MGVPRIKLSQEGPEFSRLVHGLWRLSEWNQSTKEAIELIHVCLELGITTFDHADIYGSYTCEELFGKALTEASVSRDQFELVTKCGIKLTSPNRPAHRIKSYNTSETHILQSVDNSLKNLQTDYIDLLLIHRPDPLMNADEVAKVFSKLKETGKVLHFGVSNFLPHQYNLLASRLDIPLVTNQVEYSVMNMEVQADGTLDLCQQYRIKPMAWSPFAGGRLFTEQSDQAFRVREALKAIGMEYGGVPIDQVALAWILQHPVGFLPVIGTGKIERINSAAQAFDFSISREQWFSIWGASMGFEVP